MEIPSALTEELFRLVRAGIAEEQCPVLFTFDCPKLEFSVDFLTNLSEIPLPVNCVANLLGVSQSTIFRRMKESDISTKTFSSMSDQELDNKVATIKARIPQAG